MSTLTEKPETGNQEEHPVAPFLRMDRIPHIWCPGCGIGTVVKCYASALEKSGVDLDKVSIVSGIGCTGRVAGYMNLDAFHATHGRAVPFGTGLKLGRPELQVTVFSGDGDLAGIGGNHLIHAARRNMDMLVVLVNNFLYGMTGGQTGPTTPLGSRASTMPYGNFEPPFNLVDLMATCGANYVARWTCLHIRRLTRSLTTALQRKGFRFVEVIAPCPTLYLRLNKLGTGLDRLGYYYDHSEIHHGEDTSHLEIDEEIPCGTFVDVDRPTFLERMQEHYTKVLGDKFVPMAPEGGFVHE